jgi:Leucine-rich repeat (LRR) protein
MMKKFAGSLVRILLAVLVCPTPLWCAETPPPAPSAVASFADPNLEAAVRKFVIEKRDTDKPLTEADLVNLSTIQGVGLGITNLAGLEQCQNLAALDLSKNKIIDLRPLKTLAKIQSLSLADNQIEDLSPLAEINALQYLELSRNRVKHIQTLRSLTNLASLYLSHNQIADISPVVKLPRLASLYLDHNQIRAIPGINGLTGLFTLSFNDNAIADLAPLEGLPGLYTLMLENNKIRDLGPLLEMAKKDKEQRFAPFLNVYLAGNPLSSTAKHRQFSALKELGVRINN